MFTNQCPSFLESKRLSKYIQIHGISNTYKPRTKGIKHRFILNSRPVQNVHKDTTGFKRSYITEQSYPVIDFFNSMAIYALETFLNRYFFKTDQRMNWSA